MADPVARALRTMIESTPPESALHRTMRAALTLQQMEAAGASEAQMLQAGPERLCRFVIERCNAAAHHSHGAGDADGDADAAAALSSAGSSLPPAEFPAVSSAAGSFLSNPDLSAVSAAAGSSLSAAELSSLALEVEMMWQLLCGSTNAAAHGEDEERSVRQFTTALLAMMHPLFRSMHSTVLQHLAQAQSQALMKHAHATRVQQMILQLFDEYLAAHTPRIEQPQAQPNDAATPWMDPHQHHHPQSPPSEPASSLLPLPVLRALAPSVVLAAVSKTLELLGPQAAVHVQSLFEHRVLPLLRLTAQATAIASSSAGMHSHSHSSLESDAVFTSLPALLQKEILPFFLQSSNSYSPANLRAFNAMIQECMEGGWMWGCRASLTPVLLGVLVDHFDAFCATLCDSAGEAESFFNSLLILAQMGLASCENLLVKQCLALLLARAHKLYGEEDRAIRQREQQQQPQQQRHSHPHSKGRGGTKHPNPSLAAASSPSPLDSTPASLLLPRRTCFPDYPLRLWIVYDNLWALLQNSYELHLIKGGGFLEQIGELVKAHREFYKHTQPDTIHSIGIQSRFTPDIFLELLLRCALTHQNPYVRKFVFYSLFAGTTFGGVRFSVEFLFGGVDALHAAGDAAPSSVMPLLSNCTLQPLLPSRLSLLRFWNDQFALLPSRGDARALWIQRFLRALVTQSAAAVSAGQPHANLAMHLTFLATLQPHSRGGLGAGSGSGSGAARKFAEDDEACVGLIPTPMLMESILLLAGSSVQPASSGSSAAFAQHVGSSSFPLSARVREALAQVFVRYTSCNFDEAAAAASPASSSFDPSALSPLQTLRNLSVILTHIAPPSMLLRSHPFHRSLSRRLTVLQRNEAMLSEVILWVAQRGLGLGSLSGMGVAEDQDPMSAAQLLSLVSLLPASHPTLETVSRSIWSGLLDLLAGAAAAHTPHVHAWSRMLFGLEALLGMCGAVEQEKAQAGTATQAGSSRGVIGSFLRAQPPATTNAATSAPLLLDQMLRGFLSSASCETLCTFLRSQQLLVSLYDLPPSSGDGISAEVRAVCFALVSKCIGLYPDLPAVQHLAQTLVQGAVENLLRPSASSGATPRPLDQCTSMQVLLTVISSCAAVHASSPLSSLSFLLSGSQVLALLSFLSTGGSGLVSALCGHKIVFGSVAAFRVNAVGPHDDAFGAAGADSAASPMVVVASEQELKAQYFGRSQAVRWGLLHALLALTLRELESVAIHSPELLLSPSASSTPASLLFASGPGFLSEIVVSSVIDNFDGSVAEYWGQMVQVLSVCISAIKVSATAATAALTRVDPASLSPEAQSLLVSWVGWADASKLVPLVSTVFAQSWRSLPDMSVKTGNGSALASSASHKDSAQDWIGWSWRQARSLEGTSSSGAGEPDVPPIYSSLVGLFLHPLLFSEASSAQGASVASPAQSLVKSYLLQLLVLAQKKGLRSLLYALALALVEIINAHPAIGVHYLPELCMLLTLDNKLDARFGSAATAAGGGGQEQAEERVVPMEHLIRVMLLSLMEHLVIRANAATAAAVNAPPSPVAAAAADGSYTFCAQSLHYLVSLNFLHADFGMDRCGGENPLDERERDVDELADHEEAAFAASSSASDAETGRVLARKSKSAQQQAVADSRVRVAISAIWHALCILARLRVRDEHAQLDAGGARSLKQRRMQAEAAAATGAAPSSSPTTKRPNPTKFTLSSAASAAGTLGAGSAMPPVSLIDSNYPLLDFLQNSSFILFISPALTSRIRHLLEIFLINLFVANLPAPGPAGKEDGGARRIECSLIPYLDRTVFRQNIIASFLVLAGFLCSYLVGEQFRRDQARMHSGAAASLEQDGHAASSFQPLIHSLLHRIHIWFSSPLGQVRTLAQYFFYHLFLEVFHRELFDDKGRSILPRGTVIRRGLTATAAVGEAQEQAASITLTTDALPLSSIDTSTRSGLTLQLFFPVWLFLHRCAEVGAVRARQDEYFREWAPLTRSTVAGMIDYAREYSAPSTAAVKAQVRVSRGIEGQNAESPADEDAEEDDESIEASAGVVALEDNPSSSPSSSSWSSLGTQLSSRDLLLHVRRITSEHLHHLSRFHREQSYFECNDRDPRSIANLNASAHGSLHSSEGHDATPQLGLAASAATPALNFQQKIAPLKSQFIEDAQTLLAPTAGADSSSSSASGSVAPGSAVLPSSSHLVLLASLVSNPLNLGGLCRTAEIMSATLVLPSLSLLTNDGFTGVSSTAHKWARIEVVPRENDAIVRYLREMKQRGYELVGLEQTVHSKPLQKARFGSRVVLVLGDEKRGIPAAILNALTTCVEIPQFGLIRSLNVHVSAGILVWEWIKQALEAGDSEQRGEATGARRLQ